MQCEVASVQFTWSCKWIFTYCRKKAAETNEIEEKKETNRMKMKFDGAVTTEDEETEEDYDKNVTCNKIAPNRTRKKSIL